MKPERATGQTRNNHHIYLEEAFDGVVFRAPDPIPARQSAPSFGKNYADRRNNAGPFRLPAAPITTESATFWRGPAPFASKFTLERILL